METKNQGLLKRTQTKLINGTATNPISVSVESTNQGGFHTKVLMRDHSIDSDQPFGFDGKNQGPKPKKYQWEIDEEKEKEIGIKYVYRK